MSMRLWPNGISNVPKAKIALYALLGAIAVAALAALFGGLVMLLWNWLMPDLFGFKEITFWQAVGLFVLTKIFFMHTGK